MTIAGPRRNENCPCGSGKRFKHCHGREADLALLPRGLTNSVRFVCFESHLEDFRLATNGGTAFIVRFKGVLFAITCRHVLDGFDISDLVLTDSRFGHKIAGVRGVFYPDKLRNEAEGSDLADICAIAFLEAEDTFFSGVYDLDECDAETSEAADKIVVSGFIKQNSFINPPYIQTELCFLYFTDAGQCRDFALRRGLAKFNNPGFDSISGLSGAPFIISAENVCVEWSFVADFKMTDPATYII